VSAGPGTGSGLSVPFLVDPEHEDLAEHMQLLVSGSLEVQPEELVAYGVDPGTSSGGPLLRELHMIVSGHFVVTIHRRPLTALEELRARYDEHPLRGEQFLAYKILDAMTQTLFPVLTRVSELVDSYRDLLSGAADMYLSTIANRQGEVNKHLTMIATVFLPLTFLTGFFGQNFSFLTDHVLNTPLAFAVLGIGLLFASIFGFVVYFRRKRWM
jgi:Mg2+ and Co2+ transporter CorA